MIQMAVKTKKYSWTRKHTVIYYYSKSKS